MSNYPSLEEANADIQLTQSDVDYLYAVHDALDNLISISKIENKSRYRIYKLNTDQDIAQGERFIKNIKELIQEGKIK